MAVLIEGMEMPKEERITIQIGADGAVYTVSSCKITAEKYEEKYHVIEVPELHGRLIDADALIKQVKRDGIRSDPFVRIVCDYFKNAPTIIPASKEDEA